MKVNYQKQLDGILAGITESGTVPSLLLHSCCGPCSSYVLEYLSKYFNITVFFYNPNIYPYEEYLKRVQAQKRIVSLLPVIHPVRLIIPDYTPDEFLSAARGLEGCPEGGKRCSACFALRLNRTAREAFWGGFDYFATTLTVSPHKNAEVINTIGFAASRAVGVAYLPSDFKKREGYKRSIELSREYGLYRQDYCGCKFAAGL
jgi:epoxyqueuosine reductase